jgi:hypothetical protein
MVKLFFRATYTFHTLVHTIIPPGFYSELSLHEEEAGFSAPMAPAKIHTFRRAPYASLRNRKRVFRPGPPCALILAIVHL